jgi:hypothetical protein
MVSRRTLRRPGNEISSRLVLVTGTGIRRKVTICVFICKELPKSIENGDGRSGVNFVGRKLNAYIRDFERVLAFNPEVNSRSELGVGRNNREIVWRGHEFVEGNSGDYLWTDSGWGFGIIKRPTKRGSIEQEDGISVIKMGFQFRSGLPLKYIRAITFEIFSKACYDD